MSLSRVALKPVIPRILRFNRHFSLLKIYQSKDNEKETKNPCRVASDLDIFTKNTNQNEARARRGTYEAPLRGTSTRHEANDYLLCASSVVSMRTWVVIYRSMSASSDLFAFVAVYTPNKLARYVMFCKHNIVCRCRVTRSSFFTEANRQALH